MGSLHSVFLTSLDFFLGLFFFFFLFILFCFFIYL